MGCSSSKDREIVGNNITPRNFSPQTSLKNPEKSLRLSKELLAEQLVQQLRQQFESNVDQISQELSSRDQCEDEKVNAPSDCSLDNVTVNVSSDEEVEHKRLVRISKLRAELLSTEQSYVRNMTTAMEVIMVPIIQDVIIDADISADQFNDFIAIAKFNKLILEEFEARPNEMIATLRKFTPGLKLYTSYLTHYERRMHIRAKLVNNNALHTFYAKAREHHQSSLESYLVEPVQRIPRYKMLLTELHARMLPGDAEFDIVHLAVEEVSSVAMYNNEAIREMETRLEQNELMMKVVNLTRINVLDDPSRVLILSSFNLKCTSAGSVMKPLQIWLFSDKIIYGRSSTKNKIFRSTRYSDIPLTACNVVPTKDDNGNDDDESSSFIFESERESFLIIANTVDEKSEWMSAITTAIDMTRLRSTRSRSGSITQHMAPVWKLNDASNICDICSRQFGVRARRHHCRLCGSLVCDACSPKRVALVTSGSHTYQRSESELENLSMGELDKLAQEEILRVKCKQRGVEKKERVCTVCYNNLSCQYLQHQGEQGLRIEITLVSASDLINMDFLSLSDPYVIFSCNNHSLKSRTIDDDLNPVWGTAKDTFCFVYEPKGDLEKKREIGVEVYDEDPTYDDFLGNIVIDLNQFSGLDDGRTEAIDVALEPPGSGRIQLELRVIPVR